MKNDTPIRILLVLIGAVIAFHLCIIIKIIPYNIAWGGRLKNDTEMYVFESFSILINLILMAVLLMKKRGITCYTKENLVDIILWFFLVLFILNTIGNLFAETNFEKLFSILTLISAILIWVILKNKKTLNLK
jgi:hypothetical protein